MNYFTQNMTELHITKLVLKPISAVGRRRRRLTVAEAEADKLPCRQPAKCCLPRSKPSSRGSGAESKATEGTRTTAYPGSITRSTASSNRTSRTPSCSSRGSWRTRPNGGSRSRRRSRRKTTYYL
ncbi:unnamed protein product [Nesidiocoris tenuis]|uniref:Uncharacterized protein n=1 Tax=Nesidiocoris tenuis TaxID=355587 RepID=A0A6H5G2P2_9HEMI|nr:unnamed protein product [Nesidiocoris tenuis]